MPFRRLRFHGVVLGGKGACEGWGFGGYGSGRGRGRRGGQQEQISMQALPHVVWVSAHARNSQGAPVSGMTWRREASLFAAFDTRKDISPSRLKLRRARCIFAAQTNPGGSQLRVSLCSSRVT